MSASLHHSSAPGPGSMNNQHMFATAQATAQKRAAAFQASLQGHDPANFQVPVRPSFTHLTPLSKDAPGLPPISQDEAARVKRWIDNDVEHEVRYATASKASTARLVALAQAQATDMPQDWIGPYADVPDSEARKFTGVFTDDHIRARAAGKRGKLRATLGWLPPPSNQPQQPARGRNGYQQQQQMQGSFLHGSEPDWEAKHRELQNIAQEPEILIPVRVDSEHDGVKIRDVFTWNLKDTTASSRVFVSHLLADMHIPPSLQTTFFQDIVKQIDDQLSEPPAAAFYDAVHSTFRSDHAKAVDEDDSWHVFEAAPLTTEDLVHASADNGKHEELRILVKLDITLDTLNLTDTIEWDLSDPHNNPENFAETLCVDLGLPGEFITAVAHSIREQVEAHIKSLSLVSHSLGMPITNDELKSAFLPPLTAPSAVRSLHMVTDYTPELNTLSVDDQERQLAQRERESRRKRRNTRGRQRVNLPDREPLKTVRSLVPRPGGKPPVMVQAQPVQNNDDDDDEDAYIDPEEKEESKKPRLSEFDVARPYKIPRIDAGRPRFQANIEEGGSGELDAPKRKNNRGRHKQLAALAAQGAASPGSAATNALTEIDFAKHGQRPNWIDGKWHCANCGGPENVVPGRRKGPAGEKTVCGACGRHWMRFKKNRPCEYTTSEDRHRELLRIDEENDASSKSKGKRSVSNQPPLPQQQHPPTQHLPSISGSGVSKAPGRAHTPLSDLSDVEGEQPLASTSKPTQLPQAQSDVGQTASTVTSAAVAPTHAPPSAAAPPPAVGSTSPPKKPAAGTAGPKASPPGWLLDAANELRASHPDDRFEIIPRPSKTNAGETEWRIRCHDCPGKIYTPGPGETLENFRIHVANRGHRANVNGRLDKEKGQGH